MDSVKRRYSKEEFARSGDELYENTVRRGAAPGICGTTRIGSPVGAVDCSHGRKPVDKGRVV